MKIVTSLLILCVCMPYIIHYGNAADYIPDPPYGGEVNYGSGSGGLGGVLLVIAALALFGRIRPKEEDEAKRFADILISRSTLTGKERETYIKDVRFCVKANKDKAACNQLGNRCAYIDTVGTCIVN